jgi:hypothetical protein
MFVVLLSQTSPAISTEQAGLAGAIAFLLLLLVCPPVLLITSWTQTKMRFAQLKRSQPSESDIVSIVPLAPSLSPASPTSIHPARRKGRLGVWLFAGLALVVAVGAVIFLGVAVPAQKPTTLRGRTLLYSLTLPAGWTAKPGSGRNSGYDMIASSGGAYVGIVAQDGTWGTTETVADFALKRKKNIMPDAQISDPTSVSIDGHQWLQFRSTGHNESIPISQLMFTYAGPEGTFQMCGWTTQNAFEAALPSLRRVMESFRFPETAVAAAAPTRAAALATPSVSESSLVHGYDLDYTLLFPSDWTIKKHSDPNDILANSKSLYLGVIAEEENLGGSTFIQKIAQKTITDSGATDIKVTESEKTTINGREWLGFVVKCISADKVPLAYQFYVYSGPEGTFQLIAWTTQSLFERDVDRARLIMRSFTFPKVVAPRPVPSHSSNPSMWTSVSGRELACSIRIPPNWEKKSASGDFTLIVGREAIRVGVIAEEANLGSPEIIAAIARKKVAEESTVFEATEPKPLQIDGKRWLQFVVECAETDQPPRAYQFYVYAGPEGTFQIVGWTIQNLFDRNSSEIREVMTTFEFPP